LGLGVAFETLVETPSRGQDEGADERPRAIARIAQELCHRRQLRRDDVIPVVSHPVEDRVGAGEERGVRWQGQRGRCDTPFEEDPPLGKPVDEFGSDVGIPVRSEAVSADRVERDDEHVEAAVARWHGFWRRAGYRTDNAQGRHPQAEGSRMLGRTRH
jgi:hypothetical protein